MHSEIAATVAREQTRGLSCTAASRLEELLGRSATVVELEVYAALLRGNPAGSAAQDPPHQPLKVGDVVVYLGAPTGREGLGRTGAAGLLPAPQEATQTELLGLLRTLREPPELVGATRVVHTGGLAQAAASLAVGVDLQLDAVPRLPTLLQPTEILLSETLRAIVVVAAERVAELLAIAGEHAVAAVPIGAITSEDRLRAMMKPRGAIAARLVCELPLLALQTEPEAGSAESIP